MQLIDKLTHLTDFQTVCACFLLMVCTSVRAYYIAKGLLPKYKIKAMTTPVILFISICVEISEDDVVMKILMGMLILMEIMDIISIFLDYMIKKKLGIDPNASELDEEVLKKIEAEIERLDENYGMNSEPGDDENTNSEDKEKNNQETKE